MYSKRTQKQKMVGLQVSSDIFPSRAFFPNQSGNGHVIAGAGFKVAGQSGDGFGKGTRKKLLKGAKKGAAVGFNLVQAFGSPEQKEKANQAKLASDIVMGSGPKKKPPGAALRKIMG